MTRDQKQEVIEALKEKFSQYTNFYITDTESLSVAQVTNLRRHCFNKQVEVKVAKNTLIKKALESLDSEKYAGIYDSLHKVTALMFSESPKDPAVIISSFRKELNGEKPVLKAAFLNGDIFIGDNQLSVLTKIKTKNELIGEVISLLQSPIQRVLGALQNRPEDGGNATPAAEKTEAPAETAATPEASAKAETPAAPEATAKTENAPEAKNTTEATKPEEPTADAAPETTPEA
jgi:large subunit ribosomal protein L10